jgi:CheY-like chemotaxis protein
MKTEYTILWIDDDLAQVRGDIRNITRFLLSNQVDLNIEKIEVSAGISVVEDGVFTGAFERGELDFVLIDLNMPDLNGDEIISHIRKNLKDYYTPIVFYSGDGIVKLSDSINSKNSGVSLDNYLDGIFYCHRDDITYKLTNLMTSKIERDHKIKAVRGMLIENVSLIDVNIIEALRGSFAHINENKKSKILAKIKQRFNSRNTNSAQNLSEINKLSYDEAVTYILDDLQKTDQNFRAEILRLILKHTDGCKENGEILSTFYNCTPEMPSLSKIRNKYAHQTEAELSDFHSKNNNLHIKSEVRKHKGNMTKIISLRENYE